MSAREKAVDVLIGSALLLILASLFAIGFGAIGLAIYALEMVGKHFLPQLANHWDVAFYGFLCLSSLGASLGHLRKRRLLNAFLSFAMIPMIAFVGLAQPRDSTFFVWTMLMVMFTSSDSLLTRLEFALGAFVVATSVAVNAGLLGTGTLEHLTKDSLFVAGLILFVIYFRRVQPKRNRPDVATLTDV
jgi:hypothetical protein